MSYRKHLPYLIIGLLLSAAGLYLDATSSKKTDEIVKEISNNLHQEIIQLEAEASTLLSDEAQGWPQASHSFFIMDSTEVLRWNKNDFVPDVRTLQDEFEVRLLQWPRGIFLLRKWKVDNDRFLLGVIPLQNRYKINNRYLVSGWNTFIFSSYPVNISDQPEDGYPFMWNGKLIFYLHIGPMTSDSQESGPIAWFLILAGITLLLMACYKLVSSLHARNKVEKAFVFLFLFLVTIRVAMLLFFPSPRIGLFDPTYFASSSYNRSIGDLLLNALALSVPLAYLFFNYFRMSWIKDLYLVSGVTKAIISLLLLLLCYFSLLYPFLFFETIFHNSSIALDLTQSLQFNGIRVFAYLAIIVGYTCSFMSFHVFLRLSVLTIRKRNSRFVIFLAGATVLFFLCYQLLERDYLITLGIAFFYIGLVWFMKLFTFLKRTSYSTFLYIFIAIVAYALQGAISIGKFVEEDKVNSQFRFANAFLLDRDYLGEFLLGESVLRISSDPFIQTRLGSPFLSKATVRQKVKQIYLNSYFDRYDVKIHLFNASGASYDNSTDLRFADLINNYEEQASKTNYEGVLYLKSNQSESNKRYLVVIPVSRLGMATGYIVLDLTLKRLIPRNVFPELLLDDRFLQYFKNKDFSYASFSSSVVTNSFGDFNFEKDFPVTYLTNEKLFESGIKINGYLHVGIKDETGNVTVVSSPAYPIRGLITNFSFVFTIGLNLVLMVLLAYGVVTWYHGQQLNYSARIQLYVYLAFILPLFLVSSTTLGLISKSAENQLEEEYNEKAKVMGERIAPAMDTLLGNQLAAREAIDNEVIELARLANADVSLFDAKGKLVASSQPLIYEDRILSSYVNREAFERITKNNEHSFSSSERIGTLSYNSSYYALKSAVTGNLIGILSLPFFESAYSLEKTQISVVANIITIFVIVFILFSIASYFAVQWLTFPLEFITKTLRKTTLTGSNRPLVWKSNDEIGLMVAEYNKMLENLEKSKIDLSRIQKETAWREIAKQVAHEVKNPLTPMKLTLQQMEKALANDDLSKEKTGQSLQTLLQQVEILNEIASSFSAFARMPAPILRKVDIVSLLRRVIGLHGDYKEGSVTMEEFPEVAYVMGDEQLLSRVFSNIILNALQSGIEGEKVNVRVGLLLQKELCVIRFADNGRGIDKELIDKVFLPHFSTKKTGSGIGLAIAKQGIEQNGGTIRFETMSGKGTTFYIELPLT